MAGQPDLADRYGSRAHGRPRRWLIYALGLLAGLAVDLIGYDNLGTKPVEGEQTGFAVQDDHAVSMAIAVRRDDPHRVADCVVIARSQSGAEVGRKDVLIPPAEGAVTVNTVVATSARATAGEVSDCSYNVPASLSSFPRPTG